MKAAITQVKVFGKYSPPLARADFGGAKKLLAAQPPVTLRYADYAGRATETYPLNPNGSPQGITGLTTPDGRFSIMMPHPERVVPRRAELLVSA